MDYINSKDYKLYIMKIENELSSQLFFLSKSLNRHVHMITYYKYILYIVV